MEKKSLSVVIPAYNEQANLAGTIRVITESAFGKIHDLEMIVVNDCSKDRTGAIADELAKDDRRIIVVHNPVNLGFGGSYRKGLARAIKQYVIMVPGDNEIAAESIRGIFSVVGTADIIIPYTANQADRPWIRQLISKTFTGGMNFLFGMKLRYYNGICLFPLEVIRKANISTDGFAYMAQALVRLIKVEGHSYHEVEMRILPRKEGHTKAFALRNIWSVIATVAKLWWEVRWARPAKSMRRAA